MNVSKVLFIPLFTTAVLVSSISAQDFDIDKEIARIRKELADVSAQRQTIREEIVKENREYSDYQKRTQQRFETLKAEIDSLKGLNEQFVNQNDSLSALITTSEANKRQYDLMQDRFRERIKEGLDVHNKTATHLPPMIAKNNISAIAFLKSELTSKTVDNIEAIQRLAQILKDMEEAISSIQIVQGPSPVPDI